MNWVANDYEWALLYDAGPYLSTDFPPQQPPDDALPADLNYYELDWVVQSADNTTITAHSGFYDYGNGYSYRWRDSNGNFYGGSGKYPSTTTLASISNPHLYLVLYGGETNNGDPDTWALPTEAITSFYPAAYAAGGTGGGVLPPPPPPGYVVANDVFAAAVVLEAGGGSLVYDNTGAGVQTGEPSNGDRGIWYSFTAPPGIEAVQFQVTWAGVENHHNAQLRLFTGSAVNALTAVQIGSSGSGQHARYSHPSGLNYAVAVMHVVAGTTYHLRIAFPEGLAGYWSTGTLAWTTLIWSEDYLELPTPLLDQIIIGNAVQKSAAVYGYYHEGGQRIYGGSSPSGIMGDTGPTTHPDYQTAIDWTSQGVMSGADLEYRTNPITNTQELGGQGIVRQGPEVGLGSGSPFSANLAQQSLFTLQQFGVQTTRNLYSAGDATFPWSSGVIQMAMLSAWRMTGDRILSALSNNTTPPLQGSGDPFPGQHLYPDIQYDVGPDAVLAATATLTISGAAHVQRGVEQGDYTEVEIRSLAGRLHSSNSLNTTGAQNRTGEYPGTSTPPDHDVDVGIPHGHYARQLVSAFGTTYEFRDWSWVKPADLASRPLLGTLAASASDQAATLSVDLKALQDSTGWAVFHVGQTLTRTGQMVIPTTTPSDPSRHNSSRSVIVRAVGRMDLRRRFRYLTPGVVEPEFDRLRSSGSRGVPRHWRNQTSRIAISDRVGALEAAEVARVGTRTSVLTGASGQVSVKTAKEQRGLRLGPTGRLPDNLVWPDPNPTADRPYTPP